MSDALDGRRPSYMNIKTLSAELELGETQVYSLVRQGILPKPLKLTAGCVRWRWESVVLALDSLAEPMTRAVEDDDDPIMQRIRAAQRDAEDPYILAMINARKERDAQALKPKASWKRKRVLPPPGKE